MKQNETKSPQNKQQVSQPLLDMKPTLKLICPVTLEGRKLISLYQRISAKGFMLRGGAPCPLLPISTGALSVLDLCRSNEHCHSL